MNHVINYADMTTQCPEALIQKIPLDPKEIQQLIVVLNYTIAHVEAVDVRQRLEALSAKLQPYSIL